MDTYQISIVGEKGYVRVTGDLDNEADMDRLWQSVLTLLERGGQAVVLDLSDVQTLNSFGVGKLLACYKRVKEDGSKLMTRPLSGVVRETFELLMLDKLIPVDNE
jgi:anti-sigma B factor antagonist